MSVALKGNTNKITSNVLWWLSAKRNGNVRTINSDNDGGSRGKCSVSMRICVNDCKLRGHRLNCKMPCFARSTIAFKPSQARVHLIHIRRDILSLYMSESRKMSRMFKNKINWKNSWNLMAFVYVQYAHCTCMYAISFALFEMLSTPIQAMMLFSATKNCCARSLWL